MEQLRTYKSVEPSSLVTSSAGRLMILPMILLLGNLGLGLYEDSNSNLAWTDQSPLTPASEIVHQRDPMLSLAAGEPADQELDLLFPELERIMSPLPDEMDDVSSWPPPQASGYLARTYADSVPSAHDVTYVGASAFADEAVHTAQDATGVPSSAFHQSFTDTPAPVAVLMNNGAEEYSDLTSAESGGEDRELAAARSCPSDFGSACYPSHADGNSYLMYPHSSMNGIGGSGYYACSSAASSSSLLACSHWPVSAAGSASTSHLYSSEPGTGCVRNPGEERMDTSGDSAVSSMSSSGRVSSSSEDFLETSSVDSPHSRDFNGHLGEYQHYYYGSNRNGFASSGHDRPYDSSSAGLYNNHTYSAPRSAVASSIVAPAESCDLVNDNLGHSAESSASLSSNLYSPSPSSISGGNRAGASSGQLDRTFTSLRAAAAAAASVRSRLTSETDGDGCESIASDEDSQFNRDDRRARLLKIPIATSDIINLPIDEFNERLAKYDLTEPQLSLIRDIRRRGKNKVAAQNCRKRKMDQILGLQGEVDRLFAQKESLELQQAHLLSLRDLARDKYAKLYHYIFESKQALTNSHFNNIQVRETPVDIKSNFSQPF